MDSDNEKSQIWYVEANIRYFGLIRYL